MLIQINTDNNVQGGERLNEHFTGLLESTLDRFSDQITRIELHLSDENSRKEGPGDKRCALEARVKGLQPVAVTHSAESLDQAVSGAADKMKNLLETTLGKLGAR